MKKKTNKDVCGRFAPSPTGPLHLGSLVTALASFLDVKSENGKLWLRIEDSDSQRSKTNYIELIKQQLVDHGIVWDVWPNLAHEREGVIYQSERQLIYSHFMYYLSSLDRTFLCRCTRKSLSRTNQFIEFLESGEIRYPQICRDRKSVWLYEEQTLRFKSTNRDDFVIKRLTTGDFSYAFTVVIDDYLQGITRVVRGDDLKFTIERNRQVQAILGFPFPTILHVPVVRDSNGRKLSKTDEHSKLRGGKFIEKQIAQSWTHLRKNMPSSWIKKVTPAYENYF
ncbi:glutamate--tRNA ligase family protein [Betaproteobacteria bacterium]|nr:glutamate--tRNA ligase family protein [Betaproteobacteria bacterium]